MAYTGLYEHWKVRLMQGQFVASEIIKQLQKCYFIEVAIAEHEYLELINLANQKADPNYQPNLTLKELQDQNKILKEIIEQQKQLLEQQTAVNKEQDDMILSLYKGGI